MKWTTLALLALPLIGGVLFARRRRDPSVMSSAWLTDRLRETRVPFDGPSWRFPVKKSLDESPLWNRDQMSKQRRA